MHRILMGTKYGMR